MTVRRRPQSPEARTLRRLLADGGWHPEADVRAQLGATVAPGKALRRFQARQATRANSGRTRQGPEPTEAEQIAMGAREIAVGVMRHWCEAAPAGAQHPTDVVRWRGAGEQQPVTAVVEPAPATAPVGEVAVRVIVAEEIAAVLDSALEQFQQGMQAFLIEQFAALERLLTHRPNPLQTYRPPPRQDR